MTMRSTVEFITSSSSTSSEDTLDKIVDTGVSPSAKADSGRAAVKMGSSYAMNAALARVPMRELGSYGFQSPSSKKHNNSNKSSSGSKR